MPTNSDNCSHHWSSIKAPSDILRWHCQQCHQGPHWIIQECQNCRKRCCRECSLKVGGPHTVRIRLCSACLNSLDIFLQIRWHFRTNVECSEDDTCVSQMPAAEGRYDHPCRCSPSPVPNAHKLHHTNASSLVVGAALVARRVPLGLFSR